jgi:Clp amino terminal domain, pathogenicity island component
MMSEQSGAQPAQPPSSGDVKGAFDRFTERARKVLTLAQEEARRFNHNYIGTEHLLLGLLDEGEGVATKALDNLGVELNRVRAEVERIIGRGDRMMVGQIGLTPRAKKVLQLAIDEARLLKHRYISTEHLLLGLLREGEGIAADVLKRLDVTLEQARPQVLQILASSAPGPKSNVVMCRLDDRALDALDTLIEAGVRSTRSDAAAWLIQEGIEANRALFETISANVAEIRRLREKTQRLAQQVKGDPTAPTALPAEEPPAGDGESPQPPEEPGD